jgi:hypothetical protein
MYLLKLNVCKYYFGYLISMNLYWNVTHGYFLKLVQQNLNEGKFL